MASSSNQVVSPPASARATTNDTASIFTGVPGVSTYSAGGVSSLPVLHGMADDRVRLDLGLDVTWRPRWLGEAGSLAVNAAVLNLTDNDVYDIEGYPLPGRSWRAGVALEI